jgi:hypothetical protein
MDDEVCRHENVIVDYAHPHGLMRDVAISDLRFTPKEQSRPIMILLNPRCKLCGHSLSKQDVENRSQQKGDLSDSRFNFVFP